MKTNTRLSTAMLITLILVVGCSSQDERLVELSETNMSRQAAQNEQMARQSQQVAEGSRQLVEADARARQELVEAQRSLQNDLQAERASLDRQHAELEEDRRDLAADRKREPILAAVIWSVALLTACVLPILLAIYVIRSIGTGEPEQALSELLIHELTAEQPILLPTLGPAPEQIELH